jgi:hypothetical protein
VANGTLELAKRDGRRRPRDAKGDEHGLAYRESLRTAGREVVEIVSEPGLEGYDAELSGHRMQQWRRRDLPRRAV